MFWRLLLPAFLACVCNSLANALWKLRFDKTPLSLRGVEDVIGLLRSPNIWGGMGFYGGSMLLFFYMLSNYKLSTIIPVTSMTYIINILVARFYFHESVGKIQILGTVIIILGLLILSRAGAVSK